MSTRTTRCLVIPAIKKNAVIPDQLVKRLAGVTLIQRALDTAKQVEGGKDIWVVTDSDEIRLICDRNGVNTIYNPTFTIASLNIVASLRGVLDELAQQYDHIIIYRASSPLISAGDIEDAYQLFLHEHSDCLVTVKSIKYRLWEEKGKDLNALLFNEEEQVAYLETKALFMLRASVLSASCGNALLLREEQFPLAPGLSSGNGLAAREDMDFAFLEQYPGNKAQDPGNSAIAGRTIKVTPYFLNDRSIEINSYQDWWLCEKILQSKHIVFVVAGYAAIGMGHIFRGLMLAHEIADHRITFVCTRESELAAANIAARDYRTRIQEYDTLAEDVLRQRPDLVINDMLRTDADYMAALKKARIPVVNFEDDGPGAEQADLVVNALYESQKNNPRFLYGHEFFCLRDEFLLAAQNTFSPDVRRVLITFGGTDPSDFTRQTLEAVLPLCLERNIRIAVVTGPGYLHKDALSALVAAINEKSGGETVSFTHATNVMSRMMEGVDFAIASAGRTVYELTHMRVPALVLAHHSREDMHTFARPANGFTYLGVMERYDADAVRKAFTDLCGPAIRRDLYDRMCRFDFTRNKARVIKGILSLLQEEKPA